MALKKSSRKSLLKILWARIAAATVIHAVLSALTFELCSLSAYSVFALDKQKFTVLRLRQTLIVVFAQCVPIFVRIGLGQNLDPRRWGLLRVDTALRPPILTNLRIYGIQLLSSSMVALMLASQLSNAIALNKDYYHGGASSSSPSSESPTTEATAALDESSLTGAELAQQLKARTWMAARRAACAAARAALTSSGGGGGAASGGGGGADDYSSLVASGTYADGTAFEADCSDFYGSGGAAATASAADDFATKHSWWHDEFVLLAALAAVVADTARSMRRHEHDLSFPVLASGPERTLLSSTLQHLPSLVVAAAKSASQWLLLAAFVMHVAAPLACRVLLFVFSHAVSVSGTVGEATGLPLQFALTTGGRLAAAPFEVLARAMGWTAGVGGEGSSGVGGGSGGGGGGNNTASPSETGAYFFFSVLWARLMSGGGGSSEWAGLSVLADVAYKHGELLALPWGVWWRSFVTYAATYLLLSHGVACLTRLLATPLDFNFAAGFGSAAFLEHQHPRFAAMDASEAPDSGGFAGVMRLASDGSPASQLLVNTMGIGWQEALRDRMASLEEDSSSQQQQAGEFQFGNQSLGGGGGSGGGGGGRGAGGGRQQDSDLDMGSVGGVGSSINGSLSEASSSGGGGMGDDDGGGSSSDLAWVRELNAQRAALSGLSQRVLEKEVAFHCGGRRGLGAAFWRLTSDLVHCGWLGIDIRENMPPPLKLPCWDEQDSGVGILDAAARALAFQHAAETSWQGGRLRRDLYLHGTWRQLVAVCALTVDSATLQFQTVLADKMRLNAYFSNNLGGAKDLFREQQRESGSREWTAASLVDTLLSARASTRMQKYDRIMARMANAVLTMVLPRSLRRVGRILADPLPPRLSASALQVLMWAIEALSRIVAFGAADECSEVAATALPLALTSLLGLQLTLEQVAMECSLNAVQGRAGHQQMLPEYESLSLVLETAITLLVRSSGNALPAFSFPPLYARRLQAYVNQSS